MIPILGALANGYGTMNDMNTEQQIKKVVALCEGSDFEEFCEDFAEYEHRFHQSHARDMLKTFWGVLK